MHFDKSHSMTNDKYLLYFMVSPWFHLPKLILVWSEIRVFSCESTFFHVFNLASTGGLISAGRLSKYLGKRGGYSFKETGKVPPSFCVNTLQIPTSVFKKHIVYVIPDFLQSLKNLSRVWSPYKIVTVDCCSSGTRH